MHLCGREIIIRRKPKKLKPSKPRKTIEYSKLIFAGISLFVFGISVFICVMMWRTNDLSPSAYLIPSVFVEFATATGFYYDKAKQENLNKHKMEGGATGDQ